MKLVDLLGNEIVQGDVVSLKLDTIVGQVVKVETGAIAQGLSLDGPKPTGQEQPPHIVVQVAVTTAVGANPNGVLSGILKVARPPDVKQ